MTIDRKDLLLAIVDFVNREYQEDQTFEGIQKDFPDISHIGVAYTDFEDSEFQDGIDHCLQVELDLQELACNKYLDGKRIEAFYYENSEEMLQDIKAFTFQELTRLDAKQFKN